MKFETDLPLAIYFSGDWRDVQSHHVL